MHIKATILTVLFALVVVGCVSSPGFGGSSAGACAGAQLGIVADENLHVVDMIPNNAGEKAGLQVGDVLLDVTFVAVEAPPPPCNDTVSLDANGSPLVAFGGIPAPYVVPDYPTEPVPFTDREMIRTLTEYGVVLKLRVQRDDQEVELTIRPGLFFGRPNDPNGPTATPIPSTYYYF